MLTSRGWALGAAVVVLAGAGFYLALVELLVAAAAGVGLLVASVAYVRLWPVHVRAHRALRPARRHAGAPGDVELTIRNTSPRPSPTLGVHDPFLPSGRPAGPAPDATRRWAHFRVAPLGAGQALRASYQLDGAERGVHRLGPLEVRLEDPFGLAAASVATAGEAALVVYPRVEPLDPLAPGRGGRERSQPLPLPDTAVDGDLYTLREYQMGDDLRRVHWRSTAKQDEIMIRHDDVPLEHSATVVLDLRSGVHTAATLETSLSAAASIVHAAWRRRWPVRLVTSDGTDSGLGAGQAHAEAILESLARAEPGPETAGTWQPAAAPGPAGLIVLVTTEDAPEHDFPELTDQPRSSSSYKVVVLVGSRGDHPLEQLSGARARVVRVGAGKSLAGPWAAAMAFTPAPSVRAWQ